MPRDLGRRAAGTVFIVGEWRVDPRLNEIVHRDRREHLEPRVMDLLVYLASRQGEVVTKDDLTRDVWKGSFVGDDALVTAVSALRRALHDDPRRPLLLKTIPKRGYRLIAPVTGGQVSVAVLPLENLSGDPEQEFFADGLTEALIAALGSSPRGLRVISRTSSMRYKRSSLSLPDIAHSLGVDMIVEGSVLRHGDLVRITVQLIEGETDQHLWVEVFDCSLGDVLALQSELAYHVDRRIRTELGLEEPEKAASPLQVNPGSFLEYLRGRFEFHRFTQDLFARALEHFENARALDPNSPYPYVGISEVWGWRANWGLVPTAEAGPEIEHAVRRAVEVGEDVAEAHISSAKYAFYWEWNWAKAESSFERALELNPNNATALWSYALLSICTNRTGEALSLARRSVDRDPLNPLPETLFGLALALSGRPQEALASLRRACAMDRVPPPRLILWMVLADLGRLDEAREEAADYFSVLGKVDISEALTAEAASEGYEAAMERAAKALVSQRRRGYVQPTQIARLFLHGGRHEHALEWLECAYRERDTFLVHLGWPEWQPLRSHPTFSDLLNRVGLPR